MTMYELWDRSSGNRLGAFPTPVDALHIVCEIAEKEGDESIDNLVLGMEEEAGASMPLMEGAELLKQAKRTRLATAG